MHHATIGGVTSLESSAGQCIRLVVKDEVLLPLLLHERSSQLPKVLFSIALSPSPVSKACCCAGRFTASLFPLSQSGEVEGRWGLWWDLQVAVKWMDELPLAAKHRLSSFPC